MASTWLALLGSGAGWPSGPCKLAWLQSVFSFPLGAGKAPLLSFPFWSSMLSLLHTACCVDTGGPRLMSASQPCVISSYLSSAYRPSRPTPCLCSVSRAFWSRASPGTRLEALDIFDSPCLCRGPASYSWPFFTLYFLSCFSTHLPGSLTGLSLFLYPSAFPYSGVGFWVLNSCVM